ncbi:MAG TPA: RNA pseudouridine synthase, partial [Elusimicrobiota bacterium]|nr:RNA pseudouridine synthase [Elusimicrobiota bacterium]
DREASGLVLFAKDAEAHRDLSLQFEERRVKKIYLAVAEGRLEKNVTVDQPLRLFGSGRVGVDSRGKASTTVFHVKELFKNATFVEAEPLTGRRHQIRAHLYWLGHPLLGETRYGKDFPVGGTSGLMLHGHRLTFLGPDKKPLTLRAEPSDFFLRVLDGLRRS